MTTSTSHKLQSSAPRYTPLRYVLLLFFCTLCTVTFLCTLCCTVTMSSSSSTISSVTATSDSNTNASNLNRNGSGGRGGGGRGFSQGTSTGRGFGRGSNRTSPLTQTSHFTGRCDALKGFIYDCNTGKNADSFANHQEIAGLCQSRVHLWFSSSRSHHH